MTVGIPVQSLAVLWTAPIDISIKKVRPFLFVFGGGGGGGGKAVTLLFQQQDSVNSL